MIKSDFPYHGNAADTYAWLRRNNVNIPKLEKYDATTLFLIEEKKFDIIMEENKVPTEEAIRLWTLLVGARLFAATLQKKEEEEKKRKEGTRRKYAILYKQGKWSTFEADSLAGMRQYLNLPHDTTVWITNDKALKYKRITSESAFTSMQMLPVDKDGYLYVKVGSVSPAHSPDLLEETNKVPYNAEELKRTLFPSAEIRALYRDEALLHTIEWIRNATADESVAMILAPPGCGKTRTPRSVAEELDIEYYRVKMSTSALANVPEGQQCVGSLVALYEGQAGESKEFYKAKFYPLFRAFVASWMVEASTMHAVSNKPVLMHLDEIQVFLPHTPPRVGGESTVRDFVLSALADVLNDNMLQSSWLHVILTGTNFFSPLAIKLGSALKVQPINLTGSFPIDWVCTHLLQSEFPGLVESFSDNADWFESQIGFVSANRRCVQHLVTLLRDAGTGDVMGNTRRFEKFVQDAYDKWKAPIFRALDESPSAHAIEVATILYNNRRKYGETITLRRNEVSQALLEFSQAGTVNLQLDADPNLCHILPPKGCVLRFLNDLCHQAIPLEAHEELSAWTRTSRSVDTNRGHLHERQLAAEGTIPTSTIYEVLSTKFNRTLSPVPSAVGKMFNYTARIVEEKWDRLNIDEYRVHCVRDSAADVGHRLIDVAIPVMDELAGRVVPVFFDVKDVVDECTNWRNADNTFTHPVLKDISYPHYLVFYSKHGFIHKTPQSRAVAEGKKSSAFCREEVQRLLSSTPNICIIEGHELLCSSHERLSTITTGVNSIYVSDSPAPKQSTSKAKK